MKRFSLHIGPTPARPQDNEYKNEKTNDANIARVGGKRSIDVVEE
jgi:hypothetical protein